MFSLLAAARRFLYRHDLVLHPVKLGVPVIVVGNLTVGGSGKTPLVIWLGEQFKGKGWHPGIISRGYQGSEHIIQAVTEHSDPAIVGDEPLLMAKRTHLPVFTGRDRIAVVKALLAAHPECNLIISDDGLQHYRLARDVEITVFDSRGAGNGFLLPVGPLREPMSRLNLVDAVIHNIDPGEAPPLHTHSKPPRYRMHLEGNVFVDFRNRQRTCRAQDLKGKKLLAVAGIGHPERFFSHLESLGLDIERMPFADHHRYTARDFVSKKESILLMTEKDAVKCAAINDREIWVLPVQAIVASEGKTLPDIILEKLYGSTSA